MKRAEIPGREREGREGTVGEEGAGWGGMERRTSRWGEGLQRLGDSPSYWKRRVSWRREGRKQNPAWHVGASKGHLSHFTDEETEAWGGEVVCEGQVLERLISLLSLSLSLSVLPHLPFCLESVLMDRLVGSPTQMGLGKPYSPGGLPGEVRVSIPGQRREIFKLSALLLVVSL